MGHGAGVDVVQIKMFSNGEARVDAFDVPHGAIHAGSTLP